MPQIKKQERSPEKKPNVKEISNKEFKEMVISMLKKTWEYIEEYKEIKNVVKNQSKESSI